MQAIKLLWLYRDYHGFRRAPIITRKQANASAVTARVLAVRGANRGDKGLCYGRILYWRCCPS
jgi:hypothetical protein